MNASKRIAELFEKYSSRQATPEEVEEMINLLKDGELDESLKDQLLTLWKDAEHKPATQAVDWNQMHRNIMAAAPPTIHRTVKMPWWKLSAAAAVLILLGGTWYYFNGQQTEKQTDKQQKIVQYDPATDGTESKQTIYLPDGSTVVLNEGSQLRYPPKFTGKTREVYLKGEAFFQVKSDASQPFLVHTEKITTTVLGTSFNIKAYQAEDTIAITVVSGKVQISEKKKELGLLTANQQIRYSKHSTSYSKAEVKPEPYIAWKPAGIRISNETMEEAMQQIATQFDLQVVFSNSAIMKCRLTASFGQDDQLNEILKVICGVVQANYSLQGNTVTITGNGCQ